MFDLLVPQAAALQPARPARTAHNDSVRGLYLGPERRHTNDPSWQWLALTLDEIDYGMLLLSDESRVLHANHVARSELDADHPLQLLGSEIRVRDARDVAPVREALADAARRGLRRMLAIGEGNQRVSVAVVPLGTPGPDGQPATLLMFGKRRVCQQLSVQGFARCQRLTPAETRVLEGLCTGNTPRQIADDQGVGLATVRTQVSSIRVKTGAASIQALVRQVALLPPLVGALRSVATHQPLYRHEVANDARALLA